MTRPTNSDENARAGVQSVGVALGVARVFLSEPGALALKDVARLAGLGPSAAHRHLVSLVRAGLLQQRDDGRYDLGPLALQLGFAALARVDAVDVAARHMARFVEDTGTTAMLTVWSERGPIVIRWLNGRAPIFTSIAIGTVMPVDSSATGRVFRAWRMSQACDANLRDARLERVSGDLVPGLFAAAVPVLDGTQSLVAAMTAISAGTDLDDNAVAALCTAATDASAALGLLPKPHA